MNKFTSTFVIDKYQPDHITHYCNNSTINNVMLFKSIFKEKWMLVSSSIFCSKPSGYDQPTPKKSYYQYVNFCPFCGVKL